MLRLPRWIGRALEWFPGLFASDSIYYRRFFLYLEYFIYQILRSKLWFTLVLLFVFILSVQFQFHYVSIPKLLCV